MIYRSDFSMSFGSRVTAIGSPSNGISGIKSINFFFDTFNYLTSNGKQIVLAADESPAELGLEERVTTRLDSGVTLSIQVPNYELKLGLIK